MFTFRFLILVDETIKDYYFSSPFSSAALNQMRVDFSDQIVKISRCSEVSQISSQLNYNVDEIQNDGNW